MLQAIDKDGDKSEEIESEKTHMEGKRVKLLLSIACNNLPNKDLHSLSDPMVIVNSNATGYDFAYYSYTF